MLARELSKYADGKEVLILGLPRGGVPVGFEVAKALHAPLDVFVVRKLGVPGHEELAMGAIATGGVRILNYGVIHLRKGGYRKPAECHRAVKKERSCQKRRSHGATDKRSGDVHGLGAACRQIHWSRVFIPDPLPAVKN